VRSARADAPGVDIATFAAARGPALLRLAWLLTADADAAQDLVQDTFARVMPRWATIAAGGDPEPYVRTALRSAWTDRWRRRAVRPDEVREPEHGFPDPGRADVAVEGTADRLDLDQALRRLTPRQRTVLVLRYYEDLTETQTARALGCSVNTVKSQTRHALGRLRVVAPGLVRIPAEEVSR